MPSQSHIHHSPKSKKKIIISKLHSLPADSTHHDSQSSFLYCQSHESFHDHANRKTIFTKQRLLSDSIPSRLMSCDFIYTCCGKFLIKDIFTSISKRFLLHLNWDLDGSAATRNRTARLPSSLLVWSSHCHPSLMSAASLHQLHQIPDPLVSISNSILIAFLNRKFLIMIAGNGDR